MKTSELIEILRKNVAKIEQYIRSGEIDKAREVCAYTYLFVTVNQANKPTPVERDQVNLLYGAIQGAHSAIDLYKKHLEEKNNG